MKRRDLLAGLALAGFPLEAQTAPESLYIPKPHRVGDRNFLHDFMDEFSFADLVTAAPAIHITHVPVLLDRTAGKYGTLFGHISRQNPQSKAIEEGQPAVIVFRGPHSYISPAWYAKSEAVPTWNFAVAHASGKLRPITDKEALDGRLARLIRKFENSESAYDFAKLPQSYRYGLIGGIIGFELEAELLEGKFKLGQDSSEADKQSTLKGLQSAKAPRSMYEFTAAFYQRREPASGG